MSHVNKVGVLGGGQLGRMLALAGDSLGVSCLVLDPQFDACAGHIAPHLVARYEDERALRAFTSSIQVATYEFENVPLSTAREVARAVPLCPSVRCLEAAADRLLEKQLFHRLRIPTADWAPVDSLQQLSTLAEELGYPLLLKTRRHGYDGKGQTFIRCREDVAGAWISLGRVPCIVERVVPFQRELSLIAVRSTWGETAFYPLVENHHTEGILCLTRAPAPGLTEALQARAEEFANRLLSGLDYIGILALEMFESGGQLLANEIAPRVHNSGHWTLEGAVTSQFENHLRAITGRPLGDTGVTGPSVMLNVIGRLPPRNVLDGLPGVFVHLYGKMPAPGRKLGHVTIMGANERELAARVEQVRLRLERSGLPPDRRPAAGGGLMREEVCF